jgi:hypothetical protein
MNKFFDNAERGPKLLNNFLVFVDPDDRVSRYRVNKANIRRAARFKVGDRVIGVLRIPGTITGIVSEPWTGALDHTDRISVSDDYGIYGLFTVTWNDGTDAVVGGQFLRNHRKKR